jgi:hypothetical protein
MMSPGPTDPYISSYIFARYLFIALMMEAVRTSEMSAYFNETRRRYIPEGCHHVIYNLLTCYKSESVDFFSKTTTPFSLVETERRFRGAYRFHH